MVQASNVPIDIAVAKMLDWLVDRRHCNARWQKTASVAQSAAAKALLETKNDDLVAKTTKSLGLKSNEEPDFLISKEIQEAIAKVDGSSGWTGIGASQRVKIWDNVLSLYKKDNSNLAEAAASLTRLVQKEIPAAEKSIQKLKQRQEECLARSVDLEKSSVASMSRYTEACAKLSIDSDGDVKNQILLGLHDLPTEVVEIAKCLNGLGNAKDYYQDFCKKSCGLKETDFLSELALLTADRKAVVYQSRNGKGKF